MYNAVMARWSLLVLGFVTGCFPQTASPDEVRFFDAGVSGDAGFFDGGCWSSLEVLSPRGNVNATSIASALNGTVVVGWREVGWPDGGYLAHEWVTHILPNGRWAEPKLLASYGFTIGAGQGPTRVAAGTSTGICMWDEKSVLSDAGSSYDIRASRFELDAGWQALESVLPNHMLPISSLSVGVDSAERIIMTWKQAETEGYQDVVWARRYVPGQGWEAPEKLSDPYSGQIPNFIYASPHLSVSGEHALVVWTQGNSEVIAATSSMGSNWSRNLVGKVGETSWLHASVNAAGDAVVAWYDQRWHESLSAAVYSRGLWSQPAVLADRASPDFLTAIDGQSRASVSYISYGGPGDRLQIAHRSSDAWRSPIDVFFEPTWGIRLSSLAVNEHGDGVTVWSNGVTPRISRFGSSVTTSASHSFEGVLVRPGDASGEDDRPKAVIALDGTAWFLGVTTAPEFRAVVSRCRE